MATGTITSGGVPTARQHHERLVRDVEAKRQALHARMEANGYRPCRRTADMPTHPCGPVHAEDRWWGGVDALLSNRLGEEQRARARDAEAAEFGGGKCHACGGPRPVEGMAHPTVVAQIAHLDEALANAGWKRTRGAK